MAFLRRWFIRLPILAALLVVLGTGREACAVEKVRVQLKWLHQFQFAGYYAAVAKGYYRDAGLEVELIEGAPGIDPVNVVLEGRAEFGVGTPELLLSRAKGDPVVVLGVIFQHSPYVFLVLKESGIDDVTDLAGKRVMIEPQAAELYAYLRHEKVGLEGIEILPHTFSTEALVNGDVDVMSAYSTDEPFTLRKEGIPYLIFTPRASGVDFYGDCFFTTEKEIRERPDLVKAFYEATIQGWNYALENPEEIIEMIVTKYGSVKSREELRFEAEIMRDLMHPELVPVGYMHEGRWRHILETYRELNMLDGPVDLEKFLYNPDPKLNYTPFFWGMGGALVLAVGAWSVVLPIVRLNKRLRVEIDERIKIEKKLEAACDAAILASQARMDFLNQVSHDLRSPLNAIIVQTEILRENETDESIKDQLGVIEEAGDHLLTLVNDLLDMNRLESGHIELAEEVFPVTAVIDPVAKVLGVAAKRKGLNLSVEVEKNLPDLHGDPNRLRQILFNLVGNAVKFTDTGLVCIRAGRTDSGWLRLEVEDSGSGIADADFRRIFDPFERVHSHSKNPKEGSGLGLSIVKRLTEAMGGCVKVESQLAKGSRFWVELPVFARGA